MDIINVRLRRRDEELRTLARQTLNDVWDSSRGRFRINASFGCLLEHKESGELRYYHSSSNNAAVSIRPVTVVTREDLDRFESLLLETDLEELALQRRPDTKWKLRAVTNLTFYVYKILGGTRVADSEPKLPPFLLNNRYIQSFVSESKRKKTRGLCFFRCLYVSFNCRCSVRCLCHRERDADKKIADLYNTFARHSAKAPKRVEDFRGVTTSDLIIAERVFNLKIEVVSVDAKSRCQIVWSSPKKKGHRIYLNYHSRHFSLIKNIKLVARAFVCTTCDGGFARHYNLVTHKCLGIERSRRSFIGGTYSPPKDVFARVSETLGKTVPKQYYPYRISYDIECYAEQTELDNTPSTKYLAKHELLSISVCSNVPGHTEPRCVVRREEGDDGAKACVREFLEEANRIAETASRLMRNRYDPLMKELKAIERARQSVEEEYERPSSVSESSPRRRRSPNIRQSLTRWLDIVPIIGFNSQRYDLKVLRPHMMRILIEMEEEERAATELTDDDDDDNDNDDDDADETIDQKKEATYFVVKRQGGLSCIQTKRLRFLDICNFIAPGFSYSKYLKAYECSEEKGFFSLRVDEFSGSTQRLVTTSPRRF